MNALDIIIAIIVLLGLWRGYAKGFIYTMIGFFGWFIALVAGTRLADDVAPLMVDFVDSPVLQSALGFLAVVLVIVAAIHLAAMLATKAIDFLKLSIVNKLAGGAIGAARSLLMILVAFSFSAPILVTMPIWKTSILAPELLPFAPHAKRLASEMLSDAWRQLDQP